MPDPSMTIIPGWINKLHNIILLIICEYTINIDGDKSTLFMFKYDLQKYFF